MQVERHPFFKKVERDQLKTLLESSGVRTYPHEAVICEEGSPSEAIYLILSGKVAFRKRLPTNHLLTVSYGEAGGFFGEIGVLTHEARSLRVEAHGACEIVTVPRGALLSYIEEMPGPADSLLQSVIRHLHQTTRHYVDDMVHQEKMAVVGTMMNTIIHDFKNPFCLISMSAQLLRQRHDDEHTTRLCKNVENQVDRMLAMAADLADYSKGEYHLNPVSVSLPGLFEEFKSLNYPFFDSDNIKIKMEIPDIAVLGERSKLLRVFQNLVGNAVEALEEESNGKIDITVEPRPSNKEARILIRDNGDGIHESIRDRFFEPFVTHGKSGGTGLGSAIAKSIISAHGGSISFETVKGEGTLFVITLPLAPQ
jgi:signal transduction histidine kinase